MIKSRRSLAVIATAAAAFALTACGSSSNSSEKAAQSQLGAIQSAVAQGANAASDAASSDSAAASDTASSDSGAATDSASSDGGASSEDSSSSSSSSGAGTDPANVDVCALIPAADGNSVAQANGLGAFTAAKDDLAFDQGGSACKFSFSGGKSVIMEVRAGSFIGEYVLDPKVNGLGDEAYDDGTEAAMRVGDLLVTAEMNSLPDAVTLQLLRKMVPHLR